MKLSYKIFIAFALVMVLFVVDFSVNLRLSKEVQRNSEFVANSEQIIRNSHRLQRIIFEMQSGFRGFLLTNNEFYLTSYYKAIKDWPVIFLEQKELLNKSDIQLARLDSINDKGKEWIVMAQNILTVKQDSSEKGKQAYRILFENTLQQGIGKEITDKMIMVFRDFDRYEYLVREQRREALKKAIGNTRVTSLILTCLSLLISLIAAVYITQIISKRISRMVEFAETIAKGNFTLVEDKENDELTDLSDSLNIMSATLLKNFSELEKKNNELDQFAYVVSHDLKAPLRGIDNISKWIKEDLGGELSEKLNEYLDMMSVRINRLENLINGLLEYARIGRVQKSFGKVNVYTMLKELIEILVPETFTTSIKGKMPVIIAEKIRLEQVFSNLLSNAVKYHHREDGHIEISLKDSSDDFYEFSVSDDGPGIDPEYHDKIFVIFQTLQERDAVESTGVGLAIVKKIVEEQKGTITVKSAPGKGSVFTFTWPKKPFPDNHVTLGT